MKRFTGVSGALYLCDELLRRNTESRGSHVHSLALVKPGEGDDPPGPLGPLHLPQPEDDHPVVLIELDHAPPVGEREGEAEEDVGEAGDDPHDHLGHEGGLVTAVRDMLDKRKYHIIISRTVLISYCVVVGLVTVLVAELLVLVD